MTLRLGQFLLTIVIAFALSACGGGGGSGGNTPPPPMTPPLSSDASLSSLSVTGGTLDPAFNPAVTNYTATVPHSSNSADVSAITSDNNASFTINGSNNVTVALAVGDNTITIAVTAEDGATSQTYTVVVTRLNFAQEVHFYVSLGTSLSVGIQPNASGANQLTDDGYADQLFDIIKPLFDIIEPETRELQLLKLGCPGETTTTMMDGGICTYPEGSQLAAAVAFLNAQKDKIELITIDIGANDLLEAGCLVGTAIDFDCINDVSMQISIDLPVILSALRDAADPGTPIVAMNYYNPFLAFWLIGIEGQVLAIESASAVSILNNDMGLTYAAFEIPVADVASAFQSDDFVTLVPLPLPPPNDVVPVNVSVICLLTYMCEPDPVGPNIHANPTGYGVIAATFAAILP